MKLAFEVCNPSIVGEGRCPIICLHGIFDCKTTWIAVAPQIALCTGRRVYCLDARNHGDSPWVEDFTILFMANDIMDFLNEHKIDRVILVGCSIGASVAMKFAVIYPNLVEKLVVENMVPDPFPPHGWKTVLEMLLRMKSALRAIPEGSNSIEAQTAVSDHLTINVDMVGSNEKVYKLKLHTPPLKEDNGTFKWATNLDAIEMALSTNENLSGHLTGVYRGEALFFFGAIFMSSATDDAVRRFFPNAICAYLPEIADTMHFEKPEMFVKRVSEFILGK